LHGFEPNVIVSEAENPQRLRESHEVTIDDVRQLMGASTPHFALQLRERIRALIRGLPPDHPARLEGEHEIARLDRLAYAGEVRGHPAEAGLAPLPSVGPEDALPDTGDAESAPKTGHVLREE
jgi:hypothetical protein